MSKIWRLRMEVFFRPDNSVSHRSFFAGTDGGIFDHGRCGGRLPSLWTQHIAPPIRSGSYYSSFFKIFKMVFGTIEDFISAAVSILTRIIVKLVQKSRLTNGLVFSLFFVFSLHDYFYEFWMKDMSNHNWRFMLKSDKNSRMVNTFIISIKTIQTI